MKQIWDADIRRHAHHTAWSDVVSGVAWPLWQYGTIWASAQRVHLNWYHRDHADFRSNTATSAAARLHLAVNVPPARVAWLWGHTVAVVALRTQYLGTWCPCAARA